MLVRSCYGAPCRVCSAPSCGCGGPAGQSIPPLDIIQEEIMSDAGKPVHEYDVEVNGYDTILNLTEEAAKAYPGATKRSGPPAPDHPDLRHSATPDGTAPAAAKARTAQNK